MRTFLLWICAALLLAFLSIMFVLSTIRHADARGNGDPSLCEVPVRSTYTERNGGSEDDTAAKLVLTRRLTISFECRAYLAEEDPGTNVLSELLIEQRKQWGKDLNLSTAYVYRMKIGNDWSKDVEILFGEWNFTHSPYTWIEGSFGFKISACSEMTIEFVSPWSPERKNASLNLMYEILLGEMTTQGDGTLAVLLPSGEDYFRWRGARRKPISHEERKSEGCKRK